MLVDTMQDPTINFLHNAYWVAQDESNGRCRDLTLPPV